jgi:hypothetical protein
MLDASRAGKPRLSGCDFSRNHNVQFRSTKEKPHTGRMAGKASKRVLAQKGVAKKTSRKAVKTAVSKLRKRPQAAELDLSGFPAESVVTHKLGLCLACALDVLTRHMGLSTERARSEIRCYSPSLEELSTAAPARPYFAWSADECPYCGAPPRWHALLGIARIEGGKTTDAPRRTLLKKIGDSANFTVIEEKSTERDALYQWLAKTSASLDLDSRGWLLEAARHWLGRRLPKEDWTAIFKQIRFVRRSRRLEEGFEVEVQCLYLAPVLFDEVLLIQYLLSRSHKAGGQTFEGRLTLLDLFQRLRGGGYLRRMGVKAGNPSEALEQLLEILGGEGRVKFHYIADRRDFLTRLAELKSARVPRPKR